MFLDSKDESLNMLYFIFVGSIKKIERTKEEQRERPFWGIRLHFPKNTVWPGNKFFLQYVCASNLKKVMKLIMLFIK